MQQRLINIPSIPFYTCKLIDEEMATQVRDVSLKLYTEATKYALERGIIIFGVRVKLRIKVAIVFTLTPNIFLANFNKKSCLWKW